MTKDKRKTKSVILKGDAVERAMLMAENKQEDLKEYLYTCINRYNESGIEIILAENKKLREELEQAQSQLKNTSTVENASEIENVSTVENVSPNKTDGETNYKQISEDQYIDAEEEDLLAASYV